MERFIFESNGTSGPNKINTQEIGNSHEQKNKVQKKRKQFDTFRYIIFLWEWHYKKKQIDVCRKNHECVYLAIHFTKLQNQWLGYMFMIPVILLKESDVWFYNYCVLSRCPYSYIGSKMNTYWVHCELYYSYRHRHVLFLYSLKRTWHRVMFWEAIDRYFTDIYYTLKFNIFFLYDFFRTQYWTRKIHSSFYVSNSKWLIPQQFLK